MASVYRGAGHAAAGAACRWRTRARAAQFATLLARVHAVRPRDRRADGVGRGGARLEDERVRQLGRDRRRAALLRRQVRQSARVDRGDAAPDGSHPPLRDAATTRARVRRRAPQGAARAARGASSTSASSWSARSRRSTSFPPGARTKRARVLADALARGEARHFAVKRQPAAHRGGARGVSPLGRRAAAARARPSSRRCTSERLASVRSLTRVQGGAISTSRATLDALVAARRARAVRRAARRTRRCATARWRSTTTSRRRTARPSAWRGCGCRRSSRARSPRRELPALDRPVRFVVLARPARLGARATRSTSCRRCSTRRGRRRRSRGSIGSATSSARRRASKRRDRVAKEPKRGLRDRGRGQRPGGASASRRRRRRRARRSGRPKGAAGSVGGRSAGCAAGRSQSGGRGGEPAGAVVASEADRRALARASAPRDRRAISSGSRPSAPRSAVLRPRSPGRRAGTAPRSRS